MTDSDVEKNKLMAIIGYIFPILFFVPLVTDGKDSPFAKFHANQQLILLICWVAWSVVISVMISIIHLYLIFRLLNLALFVVGVLWAISASRGEMKPLPVVGGFTLIK